MSNEGQLPPHIEETVRAVEQLHVVHQQSATAIDRALERLRGFMSHPALVSAIVIFILGWIGANFYLQQERAAWDPPPFDYLELIVSVAAVFITILILATQSRADRLASHREQLILQLAFVSEQKVGKIIALVEELRRDSPLIKDRDDPEAQQMTEKVNPDVVSEALRGIDPVTARNIGR